MEAPCRREAAGSLQHLDAGECTCSALVRYIRPAASRCSRCSPPTAYQTASLKVWYAIFTAYSLPEALGAAAAHRHLASCHKTSGQASVRMGYAEGSLMTSGQASGRSLSDAHEVHRAPCTVAVNGGHTAWNVCRIKRALIRYTRHGIPAATTREATPPHTHIHTHRRVGSGRECRGDGFGGLDHARKRKCGSRKTLFALSGVAVSTTREAVGCGDSRVIAIFDGCGGLDHARGATTET
jgi:hypothetical protein